MYKFYLKSSTTNENFMPPEDFGRHFKIALSVRLSVLLSVRPSVRYKSCLSHNSETTEANLTKLHRKVRHNKKGMSRTIFRFLRPRLRPHSGQRTNLRLSHNSETSEANLMKLYRKIKHNKKVCCTKYLGSYTQGQATIGAEV